MINRLILAFILLVIAVNANAQKGSETATEYQFLGLDFAKAKFIGSIGFVDSQKIEDVYLRAWHTLMLKESKKYNLNKYYKRPIEYNFDAMNESNKSVDVAASTIDKSYDLKQLEAKSYLEQKYKGQGSGTGIVYLVESLNKTNQIASIYVGIIDLETGTVRFLRKFKAAPSGIGFRNYWANSFKFIMRDSGNVLKRAKW